MTDNIIIKREWEVPDADRLSVDRPDYTTEEVSIDVTVSAERLAAITKSSAENIAPGESNEFNSGWFETGDYNKIIGHVFANQNLTVYLDQSDDGETLRVVTTKTYLASAYDGGFSIEIIAPYFRVRVRNTGSSTTTDFAVWTRLSTGA